MVTLYTKPECPGCKLSKIALDKAGVEFTAIDIAEDPEAYKHVTETLGYKSAPVIQWENAQGTVGGNWAGFKPDKIKELAGVLG